MKQNYISLLISLLTLVANAQNLTFERALPPITLPQNEIEFRGVRLGSASFADIDGDNDLDVLITGENDFKGHSELYENDGAGSYTLVEGTPFTSVRFSSVAFADVDGDNDLDVLITGQNNNFQEISELYANDGVGNFSLVLNTPFTGVKYGSVTFADVDGDNDQDVMITGDDGDE